jgi:hypothetical protein
MNALGQFEDFVEQLLEGNLIRRLSGAIQPIELAKKLARDMESNRSIALDRVAVHNLYDIHLHPVDFQEYAGQQGRVERELTSYLVEAARERRFTPAGPIRVRLILDGATPAHQVRIASRAQERLEDAAGGLVGGYTQRLTLPMPVPAAAPTAPSASLAFLGGEVGAGPIRVDRLPFTLGRGLENDLVIEDRRVSRYHAQLRDVQGRLSVVDLESTNGTFVNGERVHECVLRDGDRLSLGGLEAVLRLG